MIALIVTIAPMGKGILLRSLYEGQGGVEMGVDEEGLLPPVPMREDWIHDWDQNRDWDRDVLMADLAATPTLTSITAAMKMRSLGRRFPISPSSIGSIPCPVPPTRSCVGGIYLNTTTTVTHHGWTQVWTAVPSLPGFFEVLAGAAIS